MKHNEFDESRTTTEVTSGSKEDVFVHDAHDLNETEFRELADRISIYADNPNATDVATGLFMPTRSLALAAEYNGEYRAWYGSRWCPKQSQFGGRGGKHKGADIFAPSGTPLVAIVGPSRIQWNPKGSGGKWGNHLFLNFRWKDGKDYTFVYAHLKALVGSAPRNVQVGETICKANCTGNAGGAGMYCGTSNPCGGRSDHLHLELFGPNGRIDPVKWLGWNLKHADDNRCQNCK